MAKIAIVSGYKPFELGVFKESDPAVSYIKTAIRKNIISLIEGGLEWVIISGQLGTELWAAEVVFELQLEGYEELRLAVITPFLHQEEKWNEKNKELYEFVVSQADYVAAVSNKPYIGPQQFRIKDQFYLKKSDCLLIFYDEEKDGSPKYLFEMAKSYKELHPYSIYQINFYDLQMLVEEIEQKQYDMLE